VTVIVLFLTANQVADQLNVLSRSNRFWTPTTGSSLGVAVNVDLPNQPVNATFVISTTYSETFS